MKIIEVISLIARYKRFSGEGQVPVEVTVLDDVSLSINEGDFVGILGHNGSGKTTLAKQLTALLKPAGGIIYIKGMNTADDALTYEIRKTAGIVFQNPENQIIGGTVEEDVAFGMENMGVPRDIMDQRITEILDSLGLSAYRLSSPDVLSGGQKQKVALSGILAMEPACIIFDEPTSMLDPVGRQDVLNAVRFLNKEKGITVIYITHHTDEVKDADYLYLMKDAGVALSGTADEVWSMPNVVLSCGVSFPFFHDLKRRLNDAGLFIPDYVGTEDDLVDYLCGKCHSNHLIEHDRRSYQGDRCDHESVSALQKKNNEINTKSPSRDTTSSEIRLEHVSFSYDNNNSNSYALKDISISIGKGEFVGIVGQTGSGKSTLLQLLNGLLFPTKGACYYNEKNITDKDFPIKKLRQKAGLCMQYPEHQLFEETVLKDIAFGPSNMGFDQATSFEKARKAMQLVGLPSEIENLSPFTLSGGQKRRVALAGILAMEPDYLILDEPAAGLDLDGKERLFALLRDLKEKEGIGLIMVSHDMNDVAALADRVVVLKDGEILANDTSENVFTDGKMLKNAGLKQPDCVRFWTKLAASGFIALPQNEVSQSQNFKKIEVPVSILELLDRIVAQLQEDVPCKEV